MSCQVFTDENGNTKVLANNSNESILYKNAIKSNTEESAITIWSVAQTDIFKQEVQPKDLDENSEPNLKTVLAYITSKNTTEPLTAQETFNVKSSLIGTEYNDAHELATKLKEALLIPTKQTLKSLNLYNNSEINDILKDPVLKNNILETAQKILNTNTEITQSIEINKDYLRVNPNERNALGKYKMNNPNVLEAEIIEQLGGIKDENEFEQKLAESDFQTPKKPDNSQNKATTKLVAEYFKAKLGQAVNILSESEILAQLGNNNLLGSSDKVYGFYNNDTKEIFLTKDFLSSNSAIHEMWHATKGGVKIAAQKGDKTAKILLNEMNRIVEQSGMFNEQKTKEDYRQGNKDGVGVDPMIIGEKSAQNIEQYKQLLDQAKDLDSQNKDYSQTGWFKTSNNEWKYFSNGYVNQFKFKKGLKLNQEQNFEDVIEDNIIFQLYPESKKLKIVLYDNKYTNPSIAANLRQINGAYSKEQNTIYINVDNRDGKSAEHIIGHELNHFAQGMDELSTGGNKISVLIYALTSTGYNKDVDGNMREYLVNYDRTKLSDNDTKIFDEALKVFDAFDKKDDKKLLEYYDRIEGEIDSRAVELAITLKNEYGNVRATYKQLKDAVLKKDEINPNEVISLYYKSFKYNFSKLQAYAPRQNESENDYVDRMREEVEANLLGENSAEYFDRVAKENNLTEKEKKSFINRVKEFIKSFSDWIARQIGFENLTPEQASKLTTKDVLDRVTTSILQGQYKNTLFEDLSQFNRIKVVDENMQPKTNDEASQTIRATLSDDENGVVRATLSDLEGLSQNVWNSNANAVKTLLKNTQEKAVEIGLDLKGLEQSYDTKTQPQILELIRSLDFVLNNSSEQSLNNFLEVYEEFFNVDKSEQIVTEKVNEKFRNKPLVKLETKDSDYKVFKNFGLINIGNNIYLKTDALKKTLSEVDALMEANKMTLNESEMQEKVFLEDVSDSEYDADMLKKLISYRKYFGAESIKKETAEIRVPQQIENAEYLKSDFIGDMRRLQLENPDNKALQNLTFSEKGIIIKNNDLISIQELNNYLEENLNLKNYFKLNRNTNFQIEQDDDIVSERDLIVNGKELPEFEDNFRRINSETVQANTNEDFIRIGKDNFERVQGDFFVKLPTNETNFYITNTEQPTLNVNASEYVIQKSSPKIEIKNKYSQKESEQINDDIDCSKNK